MLIRDYKTCKYNAGEYILVRMKTVIKPAHGTGVDILLQALLHLSET